MTTEEIPPVETIDTVIGAHLRKLREAKHLSRPAVEEKTGISYKTVKRIEMGERSANAQQLDAITRVYGLSLHVFMRDALQGTRFGARTKAPQGPDPAT